MASNHSTPLKERKFSYSKGSDKTPRVLITHQNQHYVRGFNIHYLSPSQIGTLRREWKKVENRQWKMATKERHVMSKVSKQIGNSFRKYSTASIQGK